MFEKKSEPLLAPQKFYKRLLRFFLYASVIISFSLFLGMAGYHFIGGLGWVDSFYNASMILAGMGPALNIDQLPLPRQNPTKIFAGNYALFSGVMFISVTGLLLAPLFHRIFHKMHLDLEE